MKEIIIWLIFLIIAIVILINVTIPYYQADYQSKQAIIEMSRRLQDD